MLHGKADLLREICTFLQCSAANNLPAAPETWLAERWGKHYKIMKPGLHNAVHLRAGFQPQTGLPTGLRPPILSQIQSVR